MHAFTRGIAAAALVIAPAATLTLAAATPAVAAMSIAGHTCTIVGTDRADVLKGTSGRDVICARGGNDVIYASGGNDLVYAGDGRDTVRGGDGSDTVYGGTGADMIIGGTGNDAISAGPGSDDVSGGSGSDDIYGGTDGDTLSGGIGNDAISGAGGDDTETGGSGSDHVSGDTGNDDLTGNDGADALYGGDGTNWCTIDPEDTVHRHCVYDKAPPQIVGETLSQTTVDVSNGSVTITARVHVTDDTGVETVQANNVAELVSGDVRDGWWESTITFPRWAPPQQVDLQVDARDRTNRWGSASYPAAITVLDDNPDNDWPTVVSASVSTSSIDVRTASKTVSLTVHLTDAVSGVQQNPTFCLNAPSSESPSGYGSGPCNGLDLMSGTLRDGVWRGSVVVPKGSLGGDWELQFNASDRAHPGYTAWWWGSQQTWNYYTCGGGLCDTDDMFLLPDVGHIAVAGVDDPSPPALVSVTVTPHDVDTLAHDVTVGFDIHATDTDVDGISSVGLSITSASATVDDPSWFPGQTYDPVSGTKHDGVWHFDVVFPQGTAPATYYLDVYIQDAGHTRSFVPADGPYADQPDMTLMTASQGDGHVVVVDNPAGG